MGERYGSRGAGSPTRQEITIATADARCQDEVFISPIFLRATLREQRSVIAEKQPLFAAWDELMDRVASKGNPSLARDSKDVISQSAHIAD